jgi:hypothetical protein
MPTPSILLIPDRYKAAVLYSQIPDSGAVDFDVTRATTAYRTNASGILESVASGVPRLDYPAANGCPALLVEPAATNLTLRSEEFDDAYWTKNNSTISANATAAPDGATTADKIVAASGTVNANVVRQNITISATAQTISVFLKQGEFTWSRIRVFDRRNSTGYNLFINLATGQLGAIPAGATATISIAANGFYRVQISIPAVVGGTTECDVFVGAASSDGVADVVGDGVKGIFLWGAQLETGSVATSYIPTVAATATRNADVISKTGVSGFIGQSEGSLYAEVDLRQLTTGLILVIGDGTVDNRIQISFSSSTNLFSTIRVGGVNLDYSATIPAIPATGGVFKIALGYKANDYVFALNGVIYSPSTATRAVPACSAIYLGMNIFSASQLNDRIRAAAIYPTRLTNAELAALTTL